MGTQKFLSAGRSYLAHDWSIHSIVVILAQICICSFAWIFGGLRMHNDIALQGSTAIWIQNNPSDTTIIVTVLSTILGLINSFLLGKTVQYALLRRLSDKPLRLDTMTQWAKLAQRTMSLNGSTHRLLWALLSILWVSLLGFLTAAWSGLLAPESIVSYYDLQGNEADFLNLSISDVLTISDAPPFVPHSQPTSGFNLTANTLSWSAGNYLIDLAGNLGGAGSSAATAIYAASSNQTNPGELITIPGSQYVGNISTSGIFPADILFYTTPSAESETGYFNPSYKGLSTTYNVTQHGYTANVTCRSPTSSDPTITLNLMNSLPMVEDGYDAWFINTYSWTTNCSSGIETSTVGISSIQSTVQNDSVYGLLATSVCFSQDFTGPSNQSFLFLLGTLPGSNYDGVAPLICQVTPVVTTVQAFYDQNNIVNVLYPPLEQHLLPDPSSDSTAILMWFPALMIWTAFVLSQGGATNIMGDFLNQDFGQGVTFNTVMEAYLRGIMEYLGSFMGSLGWATNQDMTVPFYGTANIQTVGWTFHLRTQGPSLIAITLVTVLTVASGIFSIAPIKRNRDASARQQWPPRWQDPDNLYLFNPTDTTDVLLASSAGDLGRALSGLRSEEYGARRKTGKEGGSFDEAYRGLRVMLEKTDKGKPVLRIADDVEMNQDRGDVDVSVDVDLERRGFLSGQEVGVRTGAAADDEDD